MMRRMRLRGWIAPSRGLVTLTVLVMSCTGSSTGETTATPQTTPTARPTSIPPPAPGMASWVAAYESGSSSVTGAEAIALAEAFDVIGALPWMYRGDVARMKAANPDLILLAYMNATFAQRTEGRRYPSSWYLRDASGRQVRSRNFGNYLMDPTDPGWTAERVETCERFLAISHYDGCLLDLLGTAPVEAGYVTGVPIDPATGRAWSPHTWLDATSSLATAVAGGNPDAIVIGNGLQNGTRFFDRSAPSSVIMNGIDGGIAETWLRGAAQPIGRYPDLAAWKASVDMLGASDADVFVMTKTWVPGTPAQKEAWQRFAYASFLLGDVGHGYFTFSASRGADVTISPLPAIGSPVADYERTGDVFERTFTGGKVVVDPTDRAATIDLGADYLDASGNHVRSLTIAPHSAAIVTLA